jgi:signal transduction histidine kinase
VETRPAEAGGIEIDVIDNGPGMKAEVARHAFEPFYTTKGEDGVGLGLSVVYGIVKSHGGRIDLETAPGKGCRFNIFLPPGSDGDNGKDAG